MTAPTADALRHRRSAQKWARSGLVLFTLASVAANVTVVLQITSSPLRVLLAGFAPIVLAKMSHLLTKLLQGGLTDSATPKLVNWASAAAVAAIGAGAFYLSFETLRRAAEPDHGDGAWVFPFTLDLAIVVCTAVLVVIARANEHDQRVGAEAMAVQQVGDPQLPREPAVQSSEPPRIVVEAPAPRRPEAHEIPIAPPVMAPRPAVSEPLAEQVLSPAPQLPRVAAPTAEQRPTESAVQPLTWDDADTGPIAVQAEQHPAPAVHRDEDRPAPQGDGIDPQGDPRPEEPAGQPVEDAPGVAPTPRRLEVHRGGLAPAPRSAATVTRDPDDDGSAHRELAEQLVEAGRTTATADQVEKVLRLTAQGLSQRGIAEAVGISSSAVGRIQERARELAESVPVA